MKLIIRVLLACVLIAGPVSAQQQQIYPWPAWPTAASGAPSLGVAYTLAATQKACGIFSASAAKSIHQVRIRTATVTTGDTVDVRIETVDNAANGDPTGTLWATNTNASLVIASSDDNVWKTATLTADATLAVGDVFAVCVTNGAAGAMVFANFADGVYFGLPYGDLFTAAWAKQTALPLFIPEYSDNTFERIDGFTDQGAAINTSTFKSDDATNRRGNIFSLSAPVTARGCWAWVDGDAAFTVVLYDSDGSSVLATTASVNQFQRQGAAGALYFLPFTTSASLVASTNYRIAIVPSTTSTISAYDFDVPDADMLNMFPGGTTMHASVFTSSAWVETTTKRTYVGLFLEGVVGASGGKFIGGGVGH